MKIKKKSGSTVKSFCDIGTAGMTERQWESSHLIKMTSSLDKIRKTNMLSLC